MARDPGCGSYTRIVHNGRSIQQRIVLIWALALALLSGCGTAADGGTPADTSQAAHPNRWVPDGRWIRDAEGRVLMLRGVNYSALEWGNFSTQPHGPQEADFARIASWGFHVVRLPIAWAYLEPEPGKIDLSYLKTEVDRVIEFAHRHGIVVILDMHQFQWSMCFTGGLGIPTWTCDGKYKNDDFGVGRTQAESDFWSGAKAPDGRLLLDHLADVWLKVAEYYRDSPTVVAFNFFNEPSDMLTSLQTGPTYEEGVAAYERQVLFPYYQRLTGLVRGVGAQQTLVLDPAVQRASGMRVHPQPIGDANVVYAPHLYLGYLHSGTTTNDIRKDYAQAMTEAVELGGPLWVGEWGGGGPAFYRDSLTMLDEFLLGSACFGYFPSGNELVSADGVENLELINLLVRPYPVQTAGIPQVLNWDPDKHEFRYIWAEDPNHAIPDPTIVFVPTARFFPQGYTTVLSAGDSAEIDGDRLLIHVDHHSASHSLEIHPK